MTTTADVAKTTDITENFNCASGDEANLKNWVGIEEEGIYGEHLDFMEVVIGRGEGRSRLVGILQDRMINFIEEWINQDRSIKTKIGEKQEQGGVTNTLSCIIHKIRDVGVEKMQNPFFQPKSGIDLVAGLCILKDNQSEQRVLLFS